MVTRRIAVRGIIVNDGKLLCFRLKPYNTDNREDFWCTPGGGLDKGESLHDGLRREMIEETGVNPMIGNLLYVQQFKEKNTGYEHLEFFFHIVNSDDYKNIDLSKTSHGQDEIETFDFIQPKNSYIKPLFVSDENFDNLENQAVKFFDYL